MEQNQQNNHIFIQDNTNVAVYIVNLNVNFNDFKSDVAKILLPNTIILLHCTACPKNHSE